MESQKCLGIYISKTTATVVCLDIRDDTNKVLDCFSVSVEDQEQANMQKLVGLVAQGCSQRGLKFSTVQIAVDCSMVMQHSVRSEFSDPRQIRATVRFDTEDALATDISEVGLAFEVTSIDHEGSELAVFTAQKTVLSEILSALQSYNFDPIIMEPDIHCLSRFIKNTIRSEDSEPGGTLYGMLSNRSGYLVLPPLQSSEGAQKAPIVRTFMVGPSQDRNQLLSREILVTVALAENKIPVNGLKVFDAADSVDGEKLGERVGVEGSLFDFSSEAAIESDAVADCESPVDFAIAYGAALANSEKAHIANFRDDFSPYLGNKMRMQKALKFAAISVVALLLAVGIYFQMQLFRVKKDGSQLRNKFAQDYSVVALERLEDGKTFKAAVRDLRGLLRRVEAAKKGLVDTDKDSISSKLTMILTAFNECASKTDLNLKTISITSRDIKITGDTSSRTSTSELFKTIKDNDLVIVQENVTLKGNRDSFSISVVPE